MCTSLHTSDVWLLVLAEHYFRAQEHNSKSCTLSACLRACVFQELRAHKADEQGQRCHLAWLPTALQSFALDAGHID
jgi:hypothetical protein